MATIVDTLFGVSPERLDRERAAAADARALAFAKLDPFEKANFAIGRGAYGLAGALGGALGGQDPELQRVTMRQQIARQINPSDPATIQQGIAALQQAGDTEGAMLLQAEFQKMQESAALIGQREAAARASEAAATRERTPAPLVQERLAHLVALRKGKPGTPEYIAAFNASLDEQMKKQPGVVVQTGNLEDENILEKVDIPRLKQFTDAASSARALARDAEIIQRLLAGRGGGSLIKLTTDIQRSLGFETERVTANDLANALAIRGAVQIRAPGSGATSDLEFKAYVQAFPSLANSEGGRKLMSKYATAFAKRSAKLADHTRKLIREGEFSEQAIADYDDSLGPVLDDEFYKFSPGLRPNVPVYTPRAAPAETPAAPAETPAARTRSVDDVLKQYLPK